MAEVVPIRKPEIQTSLLCGCGAYVATASGTCAYCERRQRLNQEKFDGEREVVLRRDDYQCQVCGERDPAQIIVHHRPKGKLTLCRKHHAMIHLTRRPSFAFAVMKLLRQLWRELNKGIAEQRLLTELAEEQDRSRQVQQSLFPPD